LRLALSVSVTALAVFTAGSAFASWQATGNGIGSARSKAMSGTAAAKPTASVASHNVTVSWTASIFATGGPVPSYVVRRYDGVLGGVQTIGTACSGLVSGTSCVESGVPTGTWKYSVQPAAGTWRGVEGPQSDPVVVTL
jgi:hypothetical protein